VLAIVAILRGVLRPTRILADPLASEDARVEELGYFNFVTLTTVGYGDLTPLHPLVRRLATVEALLGQLYLAVLVARLVGLYIAQADRAGVRDQNP
jgi:hypothetical protein